MFRRLFRAVRHFLGAVILVFGSVCLIEVVLSARHASRVLENRAEELAIPSRLSFLELRPLVDVDTASGLMTTNSLGLRGPEPMRPKPPGTFRVLVLGDEATLAAHLPREETFCARLGEYLQGRTAIPVEVINGGQPSACPLTLSLQYRNRFAGLNADAVALVISSDDVTDDLRCRPFLRTDADGRPLACPHPAISAPTQPLDVWRSELRLVDWAADAGIDYWLGRGKQIRTDLLAESRRFEWLTSPEGDWAQPLATTLAPIEQLKFDVEAQFGRFLMLIAPDPSILDSPASGASAGWAVVRQFAAERNIPLLEPTSRFGEFQTPERFFESIESTSPAAAEDSALADLIEHRGQLSADGHRLVALELAVQVATMPGVSVAEGQTVRPE